MPFVRDRSSRVDETESDMNLEGSVLVMESDLR